MQMRSNRPTVDAVKLWLDDLRDILDEFAAEALGCKLTGEKPEQQVT